MNIAIYARNIDHSVNKYLSVINKLKIYASNICLYNKFAEFLESHAKIDGSFSTFSDVDSLPQNISFIVSLGGDGTFLETARIICTKNIPIIGINTGSLGFLANIALDDVGEIMGEITNNQYKLERRSMIEARVINGDKIIGGHALNEISLQRTKPSLITTTANVNGELLAQYRSDGLIIATPTGSTAYSMSAGGPIVAPTALNFVISPIAPHNLNIRPVVIPDDVEVTLKLETRGEKAFFSIDNQMFNIENGTELVVKKSPFSVNMLKPNSVNFYKTLKNKLFWGYDPRNDINIYQHLKELK